MEKKYPYGNIPVQERFKIIPTVDRKFYIFDYQKFTTIKTDEQLNQLRSEYRKELESFNLPVYETWKEHNLMKGDQK